MYWVKFVHYFSVVFSRLKKHNEMKKYILSLPMYEVRELSSSAGVCLFSRLHFKTITVISVQTLLQFLNRQPSIRTARILQLTLDIHKTPDQPTKDPVQMNHNLYDLRF